MEIRGDARKHIRIVLAESLFLHEEVDHLAHGDFGRNREFFVSSHHDVVSGSFAAWPSQMLVLTYHELKCAGERRLHRGDIDFAIALARVAVANFKKSA